MNYCHYASALGQLLLTEEGGLLVGLRMEGAVPENACRRETPVLVQAENWLDRYFRGENPPMNLPLAPKGTAFQRRVWDSLLTIPYGETRTYGEIAKLLGTGKMSAQAVGGAVGRNPIGIVIPCHRVVGVGGKLTGYAWGLDRKAWLLRHEQQQVGGTTCPPYMGGCF